MSFVLFLLLDFIGKQTRYNSQICSALCEFPFDLLIMFKSKQFVPYFLVEQWQNDCAPTICYIIQVRAITRSAIKKNERLHCPTYMYINMYMHAYCFYNLSDKNEIVSKNLKKKTTNKINQNEKQRYNKQSIWYPSK